MSTPVLGLPEIYVQAALKSSDQCEKQNRNRASTHDIATSLTIWLPDDGNMNYMGSYLYIHLYVYIYKYIYIHISMCFMLVISFGINFPNDFTGMWFDGGVFRTTFSKL